MSTMIERVARAMCERDGFKWFADSVHGTGNGEEPEQQREYWCDKAVAAIEALREPTDAMRNAVAANWGSRTWREYGEVIDAALKEDVSA